MPIGLPPQRMHERIFPACMNKSLLIVAITNPLSMLHSLAGDWTIFANMDLHHHHSRLIGRVQRLGEQLIRHMTGSVLTIMAKARVLQALQDTLPQASRTLIDLAAPAFRTLHAMVPCSALITPVYQLGTPGHRRCTLDACKSTGPAEWFYCGACSECCGTVRRSHKGGCRRRSVKRLYRGD